MDDAALAIKQIERFAAMRKPAPIVHLWRAPFDEPTTCAAKDGLGKFFFILILVALLRCVLFRRGGMDLTAGRELGVEDTRLRVSGCGP